MNASVGGPSGGILVAVTMRAGARLTAMARYDVLVQNLRTGRVHNASVSQTGGTANRSSLGPALSANGRFAAFDSAASSLVAGDTNDAFDVFVHDRLC
jgi:hypothetical protein